MGDPLTPFNLNVALAKIPDSYVEGGFVNTNIKVNPNDKMQAENLASARAWELELHRLTYSDSVVDRSTAGFWGNGNGSVQTLSGPPAAVGVPWGDGIFGDFSWTGTPAPTIQTGSGASAMGANTAAAVDAGWQLGTDAVTPRISPQAGASLSCQFGEVFLNPLAPQSAQAIVLGLWSVSQTYANLVSLVGSAEFDFGGLNGWGYMSAPDLFGTPTWRRFSYDAGVLTAVDTGVDQGAHIAVRVEVSDAGPAVATGQLFDLASGIVEDSFQFNMSAGQEADSYKPGVAVKRVDGGLAQGFVGSLCFAVTPIFP